MGFPREEHWSGLPFPPPGDLPDPGIKPMSPELTGRFFIIEPPGKSPALVFKSTLCMLSLFSRVLLFVTPWTVAHQAPLSTGFSRQEYWSELLCPPPGDLPDPGIKLVSIGRILYHLSHQGSLK